MPNWDDIRAVVLDMDGVIYIGRTLRRGVVELLEFLAQHGIAYRILTNRSVFSSLEISANLSAMGLAFEADRISTASEMVASYIQHHEGANRVFTIGGGNGLAASLQACAIEQMPLEQLRMSDVDRLAEAGPRQTYPLVLGWTELYDYDMATKVHRLGQRISALYSTGADRQFADEQGSMAGIAWLVGSVEALLGKKALNPAKPSHYAMELALGRLEQSPANTLVIGDSASDIQMGNLAGCRTLLVLGGATTRDELNSLDGDFVPQETVEELSDLLQS